MKDKKTLKRRIATAVICLIIIALFTWLSLLSICFILWNNEGIEDIKYFTVPDTDMVVAIELETVAFAGTQRLNIRYIDRIGRTKTLSGIINGEVVDDVILHIDHEKVRGVFYGNWEIKNNGDGTFTFTSYYEGEAFNSQCVIENVKSNVERWQNRKIYQEHWNWINIDCAVLIIMISVVTFIEVRSHRKKRLCQADGEAIDQSTPDDTPHSAEE